MRNTVKRLFKAHGWTPASVARELGVTRQTMNSRISKPGTGLCYFVQMMDVAGYDVVVVPHGSRLPEGSVRVPPEGGEWS